MQFVKIFLGPFGWGVTVSSYMLCILVWGSCMTCSNVCVCSPELHYKTKGSKILLCCFTRHGHGFKNRHSEV